MKVEIEIDGYMVLLGELAFSLNVSDYPLYACENVCIAWIDCVMELLADDEMPQLSSDDKIVVFSHLDLDEEGIGYVCRFLGVKVGEPV